MSISEKEIILIVEDSPEDYAVIERSLQKLDVMNPLYRCQNGDEALQYLSNGKDKTELLPKLIFLDLNLPGIDGREVLSIIKHQETLKKIPIIIFSTSIHEKDIRECYQSGANCYLQKPISYEEYLDIISRIRNFWLRSKYIYYPG